MNDHTRSAKTWAARNASTNRPAVSKLPQAPDVSPVVRSGTSSGGSALDRKAQNEMSARFGHDFSQVRIHTDARAEGAAAAMGANAYTLGSDIVFGPGKYQPGSSDGDRLLAHELTHVVQQSQSGGGDWGRTSHRGDASEREADSLAFQVMMGQSVSVRAAPGAAVARDELPEGGAPIAGALPPNINPFGPTELPPPAVDPVGPTQFPMGDPLNPIIPKAPPVPNIPEPPPGGFPQLPPSPATPTTPPPASGGGIWDTLLGIGSAIGGTLFDFFPPVPKSLFPGGNDNEA